MSGSTYCAVSVFSSRLTLITLPSLWMHSKRKEKQQQTILKYLHRQVITVVNVCQYNKATSLPPMLEVGDVCVCQTDS